MDKDAVGRILPKKKKPTLSPKPSEKRGQEMRSTRSPERCKELLVEAWVDSCIRLWELSNSDSPPRSKGGRTTRPYREDVSLWDGFQYLYLARIPEGEEIVRRLNKKERKK